MKKEENALYCEAIRKWGEGAQVDMAIEEMSELIQTLCKSKRRTKPKDWLGNIYEEISDVQIMIDQLNVIFDGEVLIPIVKAQKLERLRERLESEKDDE